MTLLVSEDGAVEPRQRNILISVMVVIVAVALATVVVVSGGDDDEPTATTNTTASTSSSSSTTTTVPTTSTTLAAGALDSAVYPDLTDGAPFDDPAAMVRSFATQVLGFDTDVVVGELQQGDNRSGEFAIHPPGSAAITTIPVRQVSEGSWVVLGASTDSIRLDTPIAGSKISSPQPLIGAAYAFEGTVDVTLYADGADTAIATSFVTGRGDGVLGDFNKPLPFTVPPGATRGVLVLSSASAKDGTTVTALAIRVKY